MAHIRFVLGQPRAVAAFLTLAFAAFSAQTLFARDAFVMLSGGHSPFDNNYSQYLQAKAVVTYFKQNFPPDSIWVFFGAGNVEGERPLFGDVRHEVKRDGLTMDTWLPGALVRNRPARREAILRALREEILPTVARGGTLYLFVGDHGSQTRGADAESIIDLWSLERDMKSERQWRTTSNESLGVTELRRTLAAGLGKGRVVFCMTQCHSGGFHHLAVPRQMTPNPRWFTGAPDWAMPKKAESFIMRAAGFTATDERSLAAGCEADPDPERWAGYERFIPEHLLGMNLFTLERTQKPLRSFAEAHLAATLVDQTIDKPYSTSEQYLERWANLIETQFAKETALTDRIKKQLATYQRTVDGAAPNELDLAFRQRQMLFRRFTERLVEQNPALKDLLLAGARKDLEQAIGTSRRRSRGETSDGATNRAPSNPTSTNRPPAAARRGGTNAPSETLKLWNETLRPAWKSAVDAGTVMDVLGAAAEFEQSLLKQEAKGTDYFSTTARSRLREEAFWRSGYSDPATLDTAKAEAAIRWSMTRRRQILAWAKNAEDEAVRTAAEKLLQRTSRRTNAAPTEAQPRPNQSNPPAVVSKRIAAERVLFYRRALAAWQFLLAVNERPALGRLRELTELERTPLPPGRRNKAAAGSSGSRNL